MTFTGGCAVLNFCNRGSNNAYSDGLYGYRWSTSSGCESPGPQWRLEPGKTYGVILCVDEDGVPNGKRWGGHGGHDGGSSSGHPGNNIHTHGLHISGSGNSDDVTRHTKAGECSFYQYSIPSDHMGGTHWYHPHVHYHTLDQVSGGAFGFIIVEDRGSDEIVDPSSAGPSAERQNVENFLRNPENELMLMAVRKGGAWQNLNHDGISNYTLVAGQWYRLRIITINPDAEPETLRFPFECTVRALAHDGVYRFTPPKAAASDYYLTGASRVDVAIKCDTVTTVPLELQLDFGWDYLFLLWKKRILGRRVLVQPRPVCCFNQCCHRNTQQ